MSSRVEAFFSGGSAVVAPELLGTTVRCGDVCVELTEVEAYEGESDPASHAFRGPTPRNEVMFGPPGRVYVYFSYGMHCCVNLVCAGPGTASAVLLRSGRLVDGIPAAAERRGAQVAPAGLARGPGNLARAMGIGLDASGSNLWDGPLRWQPRDDGHVVPAAEICCGPRVGVSLAADVPLRFWLRDDPTVSPYRRSPRAERAGG